MILSDLKSAPEMIRRYGLFIVSLFIIALGSATTIRASLGSSPVSVLPFTWFMGGGEGFSLFGAGLTVPPFSVGTYTILLNAVLILLQMVLLRKRYQLLQLTQFVTGMLFGLFLDVTMILTSFLHWGDSGFMFAIRFVQMLLGGTLIGFGIVCEVKSNTLMLPGEGISIAISKATGMEFGKSKILTDTSLVALGVLCCYIFFGRWRWDIVGVGTLVAMIYVGVVVRFISPRTRWIDTFLSGGRVLIEQSEEDFADAPLIITIAREYGSGGHQIGKLVAANLGIGFYDTNIIDKTAAELGIKPEFVRENEQRLSTSKLLELILTDKQIPMDLAPSENDAIFVAQSRIIRNIARQKPAVIIGRCADYVLRDHPRCLRVFVQSDKEFAIDRVMFERSIERNEAEKIINHTNHGRANHYWQYTGQKWGGSSNYDLVINSSAVGIDGAVRIITEAVKFRVNNPDKAAA